MSGGVEETKTICQFQQLNQHVRATVLDIRTAAKLLQSGEIQCLLVS